MERDLALIIPTQDRPDDLAACLASVAAYAPTCLREVVIVDDGVGGAAEAPGAIARAPLRVERNPVPIGAAASRNRALGLLGPSVEIVGFLDDDVRLTPDWFVSALTELSEDRGALTGPVRRFDSSLLARARQLRYDRRYAGLEDGDRVPFMAGGNCVVWRHAIDAVGGFPEVPTMSDTLFLAMLERLDLGCHFSSDMSVWHRNSKGLRKAVQDAWMAGGLQADTPVDYARRMTGDLRRVFGSPEPAADMVNAFLDGVFLCGHARGDSGSAGIFPTRATTAPSTTDLSNR
jgi:glycosyltransferase involved in cell wall biosynthesis